MPRWPAKVTQPLAEPAAPAVNPDQNKETVYMVRFKRHNEGNFRGLWDLDLLDDTMSIIKSLSSADGLTYCVDNLIGFLEDNGH